ncbi:MAG: hypothetical protein PWQ91_1384 [Eubacteriales bacterium]|nr:hypothetical protein [Eubacteriales bacterium]
MAFTTRADLKVKTRTPVVYTPQLLKTIRQYREETIPDDVRDRVYSLIAAANVDNSTNRRRHVQVLRAEREEREEKVKKGICPRCGGQLVMRKGRYGEFIACSNYPRCKFKWREGKK